MNGLRRRPRLVDVPGRKILQHRDVTADKVAVGVRLPPEFDRAVAVEKLLEKRGAGEPEPGAGIHAPVRVQQQLVKHLENWRLGF